jgi:hypothetical protein
MEAIYVSVWDGGTEIRTKCDYDPTTKEVSDIEVADVNGLDVLDDEYVELPDGTEIRDFTVEGNDAESLSEDEIEILRKLFYGK